MRDKGTICLFPLLHAQSGLEEILFALACVSISCAGIYVFFHFLHGGKAILSQFGRLLLVAQNNVCHSERFKAHTQRRVRRGAGKYFVKLYFEPLLPADAKPFAERLNVTLQAVLGRVFLLKCRRLVVAALFPLVQLEKTQLGKTGSAFFRVSVPRNRAVGFVFFQNGHRIGVKLVVQQIQRVQKCEHIGREGVEGVFVSVFAKPDVKPSFRRRGVGLPLQMRELVQQNRVKLLVRKHVQQNRPQIERNDSVHIGNAGVYAGVEKNFYFPATTQSRRGFFRKGVNRRIVKKGNIFFAEVA